MLTNPTVIVDVSNPSEASLALQMINEATPATWSENNQSSGLEIHVVSPIVYDAVIETIVPDATINVSGDNPGLLGLTAYATVTNPYASGGSDASTQAAFVATIMALTVICATVPLRTLAKVWARSWKA